MCLASYFSRLMETRPSRRDVWLGCNSQWTGCHYQDTWISYIDCLTHDWNGSWCTPRSHVLYLCFDPVCVQAHCSGLVFKFLKADCSASRTLSEQDCIVSVVEVRKIFISDINSQITSAVAEDPVDDKTEESRGQHTPLTDTECCKETVR